MKSEARNPKCPESIRKKQTSMNSLRISAGSNTAFCGFAHGLSFVIRISFVIRHSPFVIVTLLLLIACQTTRAAEPLKALLITGGCCHDYEAQKKIISEGISARANVTWTILHEGDS